MERPNEFIHDKIVNAFVLAKHIDPQHPSACDSSKLEEAG